MLFLVSIISFFIIRLSPVDPLGELRLNPSISQETLKAEQQRLGLDKPKIVQYGLWLKSFLKGDLGVTVTGEKVSTKLWERIPNTLLLTTVVILLTWMAGIPLGIYAALNWKKPIPWRNPTEDEQFQIYKKAAETMAGKIDVILDAFGYTRQSVLQAEKFERLCEVPEKLLNALYLYCENGEEPQPVTEAERNLWEETLAAVRRRFGNKRCVANFGLPGCYNPEFGTMYTVSVVPEYEFDDLPDRLPEPFEQKQGLTGFQMRVIDAFFAQAKGVEEQQSVLTEHTDRLPKALIRQKILIPTRLKTQQPRRVSMYVWLC